MRPPRVATKILGASTYRRFLSRGIRSCGTSMSTRGASRRGKTHAIAAEPKDHRQAEQPHSSRWEHFHGTVRRRRHDRCIVRAQHCPVENLPTALKPGDDGHAVCTSHTGTRLATASRIDSPSPPNEAACTVHLSLLGFIISAPGICIVKFVRAPVWHAPMKDRDVAQPVQVRDGSSENAGVRSTAASVLRSFRFVRLGILCSPPFVVRLSSLPLSVASVLERI